MGNQSNVPQARRHQQDPVICCGDQPRRQPLEQASAKIMNVGKQPYGKFSRSGTNSDKNDQNLHLEQTGSTYYKQKDVTIFRKPGNSLQNSTYQNPRANQNENENPSKDPRQLNPLRPITQQSQMNKPGFASFKKSTYGAFNATSSGYNTFSSTGNKDTKQNFKLNLDIKNQNQKPTPIVDNLAQKQQKQQMKRQVAKSHGPFVGQGKYGGRIEEFQNNKRIVMFLEQNRIKEPQFKFYDIKDNSCLLNNSTIMHAKKKYGKIEQKYLDQNSTSNLKVNQTLAKLQDPIELTLQVDARIILATCLLIIAIVIFVLGLTVFQSDVNFFICLMIAIILYVCYLLVCFIYNDVLEYFFNVRPFSQFQQDFKTLRETQGQLAYHIFYQTPKKSTKECYLLSKQNKFTKIQYLQNENRDIAVDQLKDKNTSFLLIRYKTKTAFMDPESQLDTINYFDGFLEQHKQLVDADYGNKRTGKKQTKQTTKKSKIGKQKKPNQTQNNFKNSLKKTDFGYQLNPIQGISSKPEQVFTICYMDEEDNGCFITMFIIFTLLGFCLPFLCIFQAYTKRYRINLLNRFKVGQGQH